MEIINKFPFNKILSPKSNVVKQDLIPSRTLAVKPHFYLIRNSTTVFPVAEGLLTMVNSLLRSIWKPTPSKSWRQKKSNIKKPWNRCFLIQINLKPSTLNSKVTVLVRWFPIKVDFWGSRTIMTPSSTTSVSQYPMSLWESKIKHIIK